MKIRKKKLDEDFSKVRTKLKKLHQFTVQKIYEAIRILKRSNIIWSQ